MGKMIGKNIMLAITQIEDTILISITKINGTIKNNKRALDSKITIAIKTIHAPAVKATAIPKAGKIQKIPKAEIIAHNNISAIAMAMIFEAVDRLGVSVIVFFPNIYSYYNLLN